MSEENPKTESLIKENIIISYGFLKNNAKIKIYNKKGYIEKNKDE